MNGLMEQYRYCCMGMKLEWGWRAYGWVLAFIIHPFPMLVGDVPYVCCCC